MTFIRNPAAYERARANAIKANYRKSHEEKWLSDPENREVYNWIFGLGEYEDREVVSPEGDFVSYRVHPMREGIFGGSFGELILNFRDSLLDWGTLTPKQVSVAKKAMERRRQYLDEAERRKAEAAVRDARSQFVGEVGERREFDVTVRFSTHYETRYGVTYINVMVDDDGNIIVGKGTKKYGNNGERVRFVATIKQHNVRDGVKQTIVNRPKFL